MPKAHIYLDNPSVAAAFANYLANCIADVESFHLALSGGSTPKLLFMELAQHYQDQIDWQKVQLYWGDERCVAPEHEESNFKMTQTYLLDALKLSPEQIHRIRGEAEPHAEAQRYEQLLRSNLPQYKGLPSFDLVILGMGADGHTASIFPDRMELLNTNALCAVATHPESGQQRISLTGAMLNAAQQTHFLVTGAAKASVVQEIFSQSGVHVTYPAAHIEASAWWMDTAAVWG